MSGHEQFDQALEVSSFNTHKIQLSQENPNWSQKQVDKQALIDFNTQMFPRQVETYLTELAGEQITKVEFSYEVIDGRLFNRFYGSFQKMIDMATSEEERLTLVSFEREALQAKQSETIYVLDASAVGRDGGVKYMDSFEKNEEGLIKHKERVDLTGEGEDLSFEEAKIKIEAFKLGEQVQALPQLVQVSALPIEIKESAVTLKTVPVVFEVLKPLFTLMQETVFIERKSTRTVIAGVSVMAKMPKLVLETEPVKLVKEEEKKEEKGKEKQAFEVKIDELKDDNKKIGTVIIKTSGSDPEVTEVKINEARVKPVAVEKKAMADAESYIVEIMGSDPEVTEVKTELKVEEQVDLEKVKEVVYRTEVIEEVVPVKKVLTMELEERDEQELEDDVLIEPPIYKFEWNKLKPLALADIPEWIWQPQAVGLDELVDWDLLLIMVFYALLNTKLILNIDREGGINYWPGEGLKAKANNNLPS